MKLFRRQPAPALQLKDLDGVAVDVASGRRMLLSIFREAGCPFCNFRVFELTHNHSDLRQSGLEIVVVFASEEEEVRRFIARQPRPFRIVADPYNTAHMRYGIESSAAGKFKALIRRFPAMLRGLREIGFAGGKRSTTLLPADFLIEADGTIADTYYGADIGDHIPMAQVEAFAARGIARLVGAA